MKSFPLTWLFTFLASWLSSGMIAGLIVTPLFKDSFGDAMRAADDMGGMAPLTFGFVVMSFAITLIFSKMDRTLPAMTRGLNAGIFVALLVIADYLILVGWSSLPPSATILSGIFTALGPILGGLAAGAYNKNAPAVSGVVLPAS